MINSKNCYYWFITYLTITSSIYHLVYWSYFNLNGLSLISVTDIIKSSILPLILSAFLLVVLNFAATFLYHKTIEPQIYSPKKSDRVSVAILNASLLLSGVYICYKIPELKILFIPAYLTGIFYSLCNMYIDKLFDKSFPTLINKRAILVLVCTMPLISIYSAYHDSRKILKNQEYTYSIINAKTINSKNDTIKLIGLSDNSFVFTSMTNDKVFFIKNDSIQLQFKK